MTDYEMLLMIKLATCIEKIHQHKRIMRDVGIYMQTEYLDDVIECLDEIHNQIQQELIIELYNEEQMRGQE